MNTKQIIQFYYDKKDKECPITGRLIRAGYQQEKGGYIDYAYQQEVEVDFRCAQPSQWWHLLVSYCDRKNPDDIFRKSIKCGELIFWMAEASECVENEKLEKLANEIIESGTPVKRRDDKKPKFRYDRRIWNDKIHELCFDEIVRKVENDYIGQ